MARSGYHLTLAAPLCWNTLFKPHPPHMHTHVSTHTHTHHTEVWIKALKNLFSLTNQRPVHHDPSNDTCGIVIACWKFCLWRQAVLNVDYYASDFPEKYTYMYTYGEGGATERGGGGNWGREKDTLASLQCTAEIPFFKLLTIPVSAYVYIPRQYPWGKKSKNKITINSGKKSTHSSTSIQCQKCPVRACC